jgi:uncharacterized protein
VALRAVFDTNIVVSTLIFGRRLAWLRNGWASGALVPVVCREMTGELLRVLAYPKFRLAPADRMALLEDYLPYADIVPLAGPSAAVLPALRDPDDIVFVRLAMTAAAPLITGDRDFEGMRDETPVKLLSVAELRELMMPQEPP